MKGYRAERLAPTPPKVRGWRTVRTPDGHRLRLALLPGGGSKAITLYHPERRNPAPVRLKAGGLALLGLLLLAGARMEDEG